MSETYTTKKERIVSQKNVKEYVEIKGEDVLYAGQTASNLIGGEYYDYTINSTTGNITINRDSPSRFRDREEVGTLNIKTKKIEFTENANDYEKFWMKKDESISNVVKKSQKKLLDEGFTPEKISEILPSNKAKGNGKEEESTNSVPASNPSPESRKQNYGNYAYPVTIRRGNQDRLKISVLSRNLRLEKNNKRLTGADRRTSNIKGSVVLPIPGNLSDRNAVDFKNGTLNPLEVAIGSLSLAALLNPSSLGDEGGRILNQARADINNVRSGVANLFTGRVLNRSGNELLARTQGAIVNPNLELLFSGPTLRPFTFNYRLSPRDRGESIVVKKIIRMFKQSSAVQLTASNFFLRSPNTYRLQFFEGSSSLGKEHAFLPRIKECALIAFSVNYTPDGTFMSYENSSMVSYDVTFAFQEIDPITSEDYKAIDGNKDEVIGF